MQISLNEPAAQFSTEEKVTDDPGIWPESQTMGLSVCVNWRDLFYAECQQIVTFIHLCLSTKGYGKHTFLVRASRPKLAACLK